jgi:hypothetical protein
MVWQWLPAVITAALLCAPAAHAVVLAAGDAHGEPGETVEIAVVLDNGGEPVSGTQNDLEVSPPLFIGSDADCTVNSAIAKSGFFHVGPCDRGRACDRLRALVLSLDDLAEIPDGSVLYRCRVSIDDAAPGGVYRVLVTNPGASSPDGDALLANGFGGRVVVGGPPGAVVQIDDVAIPTGAFVPLRVRLAGYEAATTVTNDITLSEAVHIGANEDQPFCTASLPGVTASFRFLPAGCNTGRDDCTTVRASITASEPLPLAVPLYECTVFPVPVIDPGTYVIDCPAATATDGDGAPVPIACQSALMRILPGELPPTATPTPTGAASPGSPTAVQATPTFTAALGRTATATAPIVASNEDDGCQVGAPSGSGSLVALLGPALMLVWRAVAERHAVRKGWRCGGL